MNYWATRDYWRKTKCAERNECSVRVNGGRRWVIQVPKVEWPSKIQINSTRSRSNFISHYTSASTSYSLRARELFHCYLYFSCCWKAPELYVYNIISRTDLPKPTPIVIVVCVVLLLCAVFTCAPVLSG